MALTQILQPNSIIAPMTCADKDSAIEELVKVLSKTGAITDEQKALEAVMEREASRSTGIGSGIAIPHGKSSAVKELVMAIGILPEPIDFESIDNKPVNIIMLLVSPPDQTGPHIQALAGISRLMLDAQFKAKLEKAASAEEVYSLIKTKESE